MLQRKKTRRILLAFFTLGHVLFAQPDAKIDISLQNVTLKEFMSVIESKTAFTFVYNNLDLQQRVSVKAEQADIKDVLFKALETIGLSYEIAESKIILKQNTETSGSITRKISGIIQDKEGIPILGATVMEKSGTAATTTDISGHFALIVPEHAVLVVSYIGYEKQEIPTDNRTVFRIVLKEDVKLLDEVVVVGYNTIRKKDLTTAVSIVSTEDINERPIVSAAQAIQGKAAGVQVVQYSGEPGGGISVRVRGATSIEAGNEPLYVVDGLPLGSISNLNPNDIESMQILKDASSAAIYGARAANGVVVITTKRGQENKSVVSFNAHTGVSKLGKKIEALNTEQYKAYIKDLAKFGGNVYNIPNEETRYTDWNDTFFKTGLNQHYQLSLSSGTGKTKYYTSIAYVSDKGIVEKSKYDRYNFRANLGHQQTDWLKIDLNIGYSYSKGSFVNQNSSSMRSGSILSVINTPPYMQIWDENNPSQYDEFAYGSRILHPIAANATDQIYKESQLAGSLNLDFALTKQFHYKVNFGIDESNGKWHSYLDPVSNSDGRSTKGKVHESSSRNFEWLLENLLTLETKIKDKHNLSLLGGATLQQAYSESISASGYDMLGKIRFLSGANIIEKNGVGSGFSEWTLASFLARVAYDYESRYLFSANFRTDGSSKFTPGHKWGVFPSLSAGWRISSESFMEGTKEVISDLKLRGGWGLNGNQGGISNYAWIARYWTNRTEPTTENPMPGMGVGPLTPGNRELTWETTEQFNAGIDLSLFNSRVNLTLDAYYKYTRDMLITVWLPSYVGGVGGGLQRNDGEMMNRGIELALSTRNIDAAFKWNTDFNISFNRNKVMKTGLTPVSYWATTYHTKQSAIILKEGYSLGTFYGYVSEGVDPETGDIIYKDFDGNGLTPDDRRVIGNAQPICVFGMTNTLSYKGFDLSVFFQGSYGNDIFNASKIDMTRMMDFTNQSTDVLRRWKRPGMETDIPRPGKEQNNWNSSRFVEDGSYIRLKNLTLSYNFNTEKGFLKTIGITRLQPFITGQNLFTLTKYTGYDPEVNAYGNSAIELGVDYGTYPQSKTVVAGVNIQF